MLSTYGLALVLLAISGFAVWSAWSTKHLGEEAIRSSQLSAIYETAAEAVAAEESLARQYRLEPGSPVRARFQLVAAQLEKALARVSRDGAPDDRAVVKGVLSAHAPYIESMQRLFDAVDRGDLAEVRRIDEQDSGPRFAVIKAQVENAAQAHHKHAISALDNLRQRGVFNARATPIVFFWGLILVGLFSGVLRRTSAQLNQQRERAVHDSLHDALTGLPNRMLLSDRFDQALRMGRRAETVTGLLLIDLDRFKEVNDTLGHQYGDRLLEQIGSRLGSALREVDTIARLGGDEFAIVLPVVVDLAGALQVAERVRATLIQPFELDGVEVEIEASIGVVISGTHGDEASTLMQRADVAMYRAKEMGQGVMAYDASADTHSPERLALLGQLRRGIGRGELFLHYQPKISVLTGEVTGVEALVRWQHPDRGLVSPDDFIPFAERTGLIGPLTQCVLTMALAQVKAWAVDGHVIPVAVNISARNLFDDKLVDFVSDLLQKHQLPAAILCLEVTESAIMLEPARAHDILNRLHVLGVRISIDDFGAGYTSLAQLKTLPISELKIDRSFVMTMHKEQADTLIVRSIIDLGHNLGLTVVAEGVETAEAHGSLTSYACDIAQGYHFCRPQAAAEFFRWHTDRIDAVGLAGGLQPGLDLPMAVHS